MTISWHRSEPLTAGTSLLDRNVLDQMRAELALRATLAGIAAGTVPNIPSPLTKSAVANYLRQMFSIASGLAGSPVAPYDSLDAADNFRTSAYTAVYAGPGSPSDPESLDANHDTMPQTWQAAVTTIRSIIDGLTYIERDFRGAEYHEIGSGPGGSSGYEDVTIDSSGSIPTWTPDWADPSTSVGYDNNGSNAYGSIDRYGTWLGIDASSPRRWRRRRTRSLLKFDTTSLASVSTFDLYQIVFLPLAADVHSYAKGTLSWFVRKGIFGGSTVDITTAGLPTEWGLVRLRVEQITSALFNSPDLTTDGTVVEDRTSSSWTPNTTFDLDPVDVSSLAATRPLYMGLSLNGYMGTDRDCEDWAYVESGVGQWNIHTFCQSAAKWALRARFAVPASGWTAA
jgi:hypothetical protein